MSAGALSARQCSPVVQVPTQSLRRGTTASPCGRPPLYTRRVPDAQVSSSLVQHERDLFRRLLELGTYDNAEPFLAEAVALIARVSSAQRAYLELFDEREGPGTESLWAVSGCEADETPTFRMGLSHSVIAEVLSSEETLLLASAVDHPRFGEHGSVRRHRIQAVLCAPVITGTSRGVIYLQGRADPGAAERKEHVPGPAYARRSPSDYRSNAPASPRGPRHGQGAGFRSSAAFRRADAAVRWRGQGAVVRSRANGRHVCQ